MSEKDKYSKKKYSKLKMHEDKTFRGQLTMPEDKIFKSQNVLGQILQRTKHPENKY